MTLREQFDEDLSIFMDLDEMATEHRISVGQASSVISCVVDNDAAQRNSLQSPGGNYDGDFLFFAKTADVHNLKPDILIRFDGVPYQVTGVVEEDGMTQITLAAGQGGF